MAGSAFGKFDFMQLFGGGARDACLFESKDSKVDLSAICHEVRGVDLDQGENASISLQDARRRSGEQLSPLGKACHVRSCELDSTLILRVWASRERRKTDEANGEDVFDVDASDESPLTRCGARRRLCGELRIPLQRFVLQCQDTLYQSWVTLDSPGDMNSAVSSDGMFDQKLVDGPRQMHKPRICLTVCKTANLSPSGKLLLAFEAPQEDRLSQWPALLRSQQQHHVMSKALYLQSLQLQGEEWSDARGERGMGSLNIRALQGRVDEQSNTIEELHQQISQVEARIRERKLNEKELSISEGDSPRKARVEAQLAEAARLHEQVGTRMSTGAPASLVEPGFGDPMMRKEAMETEAQQLRAENEKQSSDIENFRAQLAEVREEANSKIDAANERIRLLRRERDDNRQEREFINLEVRRLEEDNENLSVGNMQLAEQRDALLRIVEDLHQSTVASGLNTDAARLSVDSIRATIKNFSYP